VAKDWKILMKNSMIRTLQIIAKAIRVPFRIILGPILDERIRKFKNNDQGAMQNILKMLYISQVGLATSSLPTYGFNNFSQFEEDGILLYIFSRIGETNRKVLELGAGSARECMASNLIINHNWQGFLVDGSDKNRKIAREFFSNFHNTRIWQPKFLVRWITAENVNEICEDFEINGEIDLLSLDIDGNDYWVLSALERVSPRVIVLEIQNSIPASVSVARPYLADFDLHDYSGIERSFRGASISAFNLLLEERGYMLIGTTTNGINAFFVKKTLGQGKFQLVNPVNTLDDPYSRSQQMIWPELSNLPWVTIE
jgi:hypothetical protein